MLELRRELKEKTEKLKISFARGRAVDLWTQGRGYFSYGKKIHKLENICNFILYPVNTQILLIQI